MCNYSATPFDIIIHVTVYCLPFHYLSPKKKIKSTGLYSFIDDVGEKHLVRYAASADRGFEVFNSVPDASRYVQYSAPLYKTSPKARGRIAYERGPGRQYKFISAGPDQRRSESA